MLKQLIRKWKMSKFSIPESKLVGEDSFGNKYYEKLDPIHPRKLFFFILSSLLFSLYLFIFIHILLLYNII